MHSPPTTEWPEIFPRDLDKPLISRDAPDYPWIYKCGHPECQRGPTAHKTREDADKLRVQHVRTQCPQIAITTEKVLTMAEETLHAKVWAELDAATAAVMDGREQAKVDNTIEFQKAYNEKRGNARGLATAIFHMGTPFWETSTDVAKHAVARYKARAAGEPLPDTLGVDGYNPHLALARSKEAVPAKNPAKATAAPTPAVTKPKAKLSEDQLRDLMTGIQGGLPHVSLAKLYKVDVSYVQELAKTPS